MPQPENIVLGPRQYVCWWRDWWKEEATCSFFAADDASALGLANRMAAKSNAKLFRLCCYYDIGPVTSADPADGSNIQSKTFFHYKCERYEPVSLSVPSFDVSLLEDNHERSFTDHIGGASVLQNRRGFSVTGFIKALFNYWQRDDKPAE